MGDVIAVYCDGGVIWDGSPGASMIGGTWAYCFVDVDGNRVKEESGVIESTPTRHVTNNWSEQISIVKALEALPDGWSGTIYSDSMIALGRVFKGWREKNLPRNISERSRDARRRLGKVETVLLAGHPTKKELETGMSKRKPGLLVSIHNVRVDELCTLAGKKFMEERELLESYQPFDDIAITDISRGSNIYGRNRRDWWERLKRTGTLRSSTLN